MKRVVVAATASMMGCGSVSAPAVDAKLSDSPAVDGTNVDAPAAPRCDPTKPFSSPTILANVNSATDDTTPFVTGDELQLWFASNRPGSQAMDIYMASRTSKTADFGTPALAAGVNTAGFDTRPTLTADGLTIYIQYLASTTGLYKITSATRSSTSVGFGTPAEVTTLSSSTNDDAPFVLPDHSAIYFLSNRTNNAFQIWRATRSGGVFQTPVLADGVDINAAGDDYPTLLPDDRTMYFLSSRTGTVGGNDNWKVTRPTTVQAYGAATNVSELNATDGYYIFSVTADDCVAYIAGPNGSNGTDLFVAKKPL